VGNKESAHIKQEKREELDNTDMMNLEDESNLNDSDIKDTKT
jgi:hypothetical protein